MRYDSLNYVLNQHRSQNYECINTEWLTLKAKFQNVFETQGVGGLRLAIWDKKRDINVAQDQTSRVKSISLKVCDISEYL